MVFTSGRIVINNSPEFKAITDEIIKSENKMPMINGKSFHCDCGCNVFHNPTEDERLYKCNSCGEYYRGE